jgi:hypothetical protein
MKNKILLLENLIKMPKISKAKFQIPDTIITKMKILQ